VNTYLKPLLRFLQSDDGPTAVEYAVMLALIMMACIAAVTLLGSNTGASFADSQQKITNAINSGGS